MQFEQGYVVVQRLRVVIVVDVGGGHAKSLRSRTAKLLREVVITNTDVDGVTRAHDAEKNKKGRLEHETNVKK